MPEVKITETEAVTEVTVEVIEVTVEEEVAEMTADPMVTDPKDASIAEKKVTLLEIAQSLENKDNSTVIEIKEVIEATETSRVIAETEETVIVIARNKEAIAEVEARATTERRNHQETKATDRKSVV